MPCFEEIPPTSFRIQPSCGERPGTETMTRSSGHFQPAVSGGLPTKSASSTFRLALSDCRDASWPGVTVLRALGEATLATELRDSETEQVLARILDQRAVSGVALA
jgi:hypothetical protein